MEIRIVPMSLIELDFSGKTIKEVQKDFFDKSLKIYEKGWYHYKTSGLDAKSGDLILFQMESQIIASAILDQVIVFSKNIKLENAGAYVLIPKTIKTFKPITEIEIEYLIPSFNHFNQTKPRFKKDEVKYDELCKRMDLRD